jgi:uncharacterized protein (DUF1330 family)
MAAYVVSIARVDDWSENFRKYADLAADLTAKLGAEYVIRGEPVTNCEGKIFDDRVLVISKWPSLDVAQSYWNSSEYQEKIKPLRDNTGIYDVAIFEEA